MPKTNFEGVMKSLAPPAVAYQKDVKEGTFEVYAAYLSDIPPQYTRAAVDELVKTSRWIPTIAELRETARTIWMQERGLEEETAEHAWVLLLELMKKHGFNEPKRDAFSSDAAHTAMRSVGWRSICMATDAQLIQLHRAYVKAYDGVKGDKPALVAKAKGLIEA